MSDLIIGLDFLTGRCVAANVANRDQSEWPPHPGRVFMAMAAACFERGEDQAEVAALKWLESIEDPPQIFASESTTRSLVKYYVPVNDKLTASKSLLQSTPGLARSKQERSYPTAIPLDPVVKFVWCNATEVDDHISALSNICSNVIRVGHSSSLVGAWAEVTESNDDLEFREGHVAWQPIRGNSELRTRIAGDGEFERLRSACNAAAIDQFGELKATIESTKGAEQKEVKKVFESKFGQPFKSSLRAPEPTPPVLGLWQGYSRADAGDQNEAVEGNYFNSELLILTKMDSPNLGIQDTLALTSRLRDAAMSHCPENPPPPWLGGHDADRTPTQQPHTAFVALPFVGMDYADGHVMGLALALPKEASPEDRGRLLGPLLVNDDGESHDVELKLGRLGTWTVRLEERAEPPRSLRNTSWVGPNSTWASVTPVVLDKFPKSSRVDERGSWEAEVRETIALSCNRAGLPRPVEIDLDTTSWHVGSPRAFGKQRRMRSRNAANEQTGSGDGFPPLPSRKGKPSRPQIHVFLRFERQFADRYCSELAGFLAMDCVNL
jgi:CRISPR-associated protein Csb2